MPLKIVHCADLHIDSAHALFGDRAARRAAEVANALYNITKHCRETGAEVLLIAGDLFDNPCPQEAWVESARENLASLTETEVFIVAGNHDYITPSSPYLKDWGEHIHILKQNECLEFDTFRVYGESFFEPFSGGITLPTAKDDGKINILLMHGDVFGGEYNPLTEQKIAATKMDYVALGHVHSYSGVKYAHGVAYAYPGSCEPLGFDEIGDHGVLSGTIFKGQADLTFVPLCRRRFLELSADVAPFSDNAELERHLKELLTPYKNDMIKIILSGECDFKVNRERLKTALEESVFFLKIKDRTYPKENLELLRKEQTLKGFFADKMLTVIETARGEEKEKAERALRLGLAAFAGREVGAIED